MGKHQRNRRRRPDHLNPTGLITVQNTEKHVASAVEHPVSSTVKKLKESLCSPNAETRICACSSIANFASEAFSELVQSGIVKILGPLLVDENATLRTNAIGALRNLSLSGGPELCQQMVTDDVMTPLSTLLQKMCETLTNPKESKAQFVVLEQAIHLLWNLCESSGVAVNIFNKQQLCQILLLAFNSGQCSVPLLTVIAQCLLTVAEDNEEVTKILRQDDVVHSLNRCFKSDQNSPEVILLKVNIAGILCSVGSSSESSSEMVTEIILFLVSVLQQNITGHLQQVLEAIVKIENIKTPPISMEAENPLDSVNVNEDENEKDEDMKNNEGATNSTAQRVPSSPRKDPRSDQEILLETKLTEAKNVIQAQQTALEILTNLTCPQDDEEEWEDLESSDTSADEMSMETEESQCPLVEESLVSDDVISNIIKHGVIDRVLEKCQVHDQTMTQNLLANSDSKSLVKSLTRLRCCALICLSNIVGALSSEVLADTVNVNIGTALTQMWAQLGDILNSSVTSSPPDVEIAEASSSALRAVLEKLEDFAPEKLKEVSEADLQWLCTTELSCDTPQTRVNLIRVVGCIGNALAENESPHPNLQGIGEFFCEVCSREQEIWVVAECLDCIYDVFGEDHLNGVLKQIQLIDKLRALLPSLKTKFQQQKGILGEHLPIVSTAKTNLSRFIKYKTKVMK